MIILKLTRRARLLGEASTVAGVLYCTVTVLDNCHVSMLMAEDSRFYYVTACLTAQTGIGFMRRNNTRKGKVNPLH